MSDSTLLSDLCSICNTNASKYRCPGCAARTCSLPCYKRHQSWAQCSGQRDPTKFVKKSQLVTPAGIDHDFNFLTGIERNLEKAERTVNATSIGAPSDSQPKSRNQPGGIPYGRLEAAAGVKIIRAPKGLSRQKENKSHPSSTKKSKSNIVWTVEWIDDAKRRVLTETSSTFLIADATPFGQHKSKKRKHGAEVSLTAKITEVQDAAHTPTNQNKSLKSLEHQLDIDTEEPKRLSSGRGTSPIIEAQVPEASQGEDHLADSHDSNPRNDGPSTQSMGDGQYRFFLLRPRTSSSRHVLVPLDLQHTLAECLRGRTVLEFPTIYVFPSAMQPLPAEFMLEEEYLRQEGEEQKEFDDLLKELDPEILKRLKDERPHEESAREEEVDSKRILDVLRQDLGGGL
ncbi:Nn.00g020480.m01.CDS01 [Neocucurbitaria sp. VM-36]